MVKYKSQLLNLSRLNALAVVGVLLLADPVVGARGSASVFLATALSVLGNGSAGDSALESRFPDVVGSSTVCNYG